MTGGPQAVSDRICDDIYVAHLADSVVVKSEHPADHDLAKAFYTYTKVLSCVPCSICSYVIKAP